MTCIVGLIENGIVYMGGDSADCDDSSLNIIKGSKVFKKEEFLFGISGNPRMSDILRYNFEIPYKNDDQDILEYMHRYFIPKLKESLIENGVLIKQNEAISSDSWVMIGYQGRLFILKPHFHLSESLLNYDALGSGMDAALGCLYGMESLMNNEWILKLDPQTRLTLALRASERFNCNVKRPFTILSTAQQD
jgi:hypothetical protein